MFENVLYQDAVTALLKSDLERATLPQSVLFAGSAKCAKLTTALEVARALSCEKKNALWDCPCAECVRARNLSATTTLILGNKDTITEITANKFAFLNERIAGSRYEAAAKMGFIRSVRKLLIRFSPILYSEDKNLTKITNLALDADEWLGEVERADDNTKDEVLERAIEKIIGDCAKLEADHLPRATPVDQIRAVKAFAQIKSPVHKCVIIEKAHVMANAAQNALLKLLEEPPADCSFILTTVNKQNVLKTILSRVRVYQFDERTLSQEEEVTERIFHTHFEGFVQDFLANFLSVKRDTLCRAAKTYIDATLAPKNGAQNKTSLTFQNDKSTFDTKNPLNTPSCPSMEATVEKVIADCKNFSEDAILTIFFKELLAALQKTSLHPVEKLKALKAIQSSYTKITTFNQSVRSALEALFFELAQSE